MSVVIDDTGIEQFITLDDFKLVLQIADTQDDDLLLTFVNNANNKVHTTIFPFVPTPLSQGSIYWSRCGNAALAYARSLHAEDIEQLKKAENYLSKYNYEMYGEDGKHGLIEELRKTPTDRQIPMHIDVTDIAGERLTPFSQIGYGGSENALL